MPVILGFGHQKCVGKDELVKFCIDIFRPMSGRKRLVRRGFADRVYDVCNSLYGWAGFQPRIYYAENPKAKNDVLENGKTVRQMLIEIGTPVMRAYDPDVWINAALKPKDFDVLFINDLRFPNEFEAVRKMGGHLIRVSRPGLEEPTDVADTALNGYHQPWDMYIENCGTLSDLHHQAEMIVATYLVGKV